MEDHAPPESRADQPCVYQIRLKGHLDPQWTEWFGGLSISLEENGDTVLTGIVVDQAALHGLLRTVRDLGVPLVSVTRISPCRSRLPDARTRGGGGGP